MKKGCAISDITEVYQGVQYARTVEKKDWVFTCVRDGITFSAIEHCFSGGSVWFDRPKSSKLFPIRLRKKVGLDYLVYVYSAHQNLGRQLL